MGIRRSCLCLSALAALWVSDAFSALPTGGTPLQSLTFAADSPDALGRCRARINNGRGEERTSGPAFVGQGDDEDCVPPWVVQNPELYAELKEMGCELCEE